MELDSSAKELLVEKGFDAAYGARPLKRVIQRFVEDPLAEEVIAKRIKSGDVVRVFRKGDTLTFAEPVAAHPTATSG